MFDTKDFIFKKTRSVYIVPAESIEDAWTRLAKRQSMSIENCKKQYTYIDSMDYEIKKIKL